MKEIADQNPVTIVFEEGVPPMTETVRLANANTVLPGTLGVLPIPASARRMEAEESPDC